MSTRFTTVLMNRHDCPHGYQPLPRAISPVMEVDAECIGLRASRSCHWVLRIHVADPPECCGGAQRALSSEHLLYGLCSPCFTFTASRNDRHGALIVSPIDLCLSLFSMPDPSDESGVSALTQRMRVSGSARHESVRRQRFSRYSSPSMRSFNVSSKRFQSYRLQRRSLLWGVEATCSHSMLDITPYAMCSFE